MPSPLSPDSVRPILEEHILADGLPLVVDLERSQGAWLVDAVSGDSFLDFFSSFSTCTLGFNHPALTEKEFASRLLSAAVNKISNSDLYTGALAGFVRSFATVLPPSLRDHLFFIEGGAPAVENALKTAFDWKKRLNLRRGSSAEGSQILHFQEGFHGRTGYTLSITSSDPHKTDYFPKFDWPRLSNPKLTFPVTENALAATLEAEDRAIAEIQRALADYPDDIAALIIEPIQGEGGDNHFRAEFLATLRDLATENEFLLIFDEVQTGFGATGRWWCFEHFDVVPDVLVFGKKTQVCGIAATRRIDEIDSVFALSSRINSTWGGNLVDMVRCEKFIEVIENDGLLDQASRVGGEILAGLQVLAQDSELVDNPRGRGLFLAFDLPNADMRDRMLAGLRSERLLALPSGRRSIRFRPPLLLTSEEAQLGLDRCRSVLEQLLTPAGEAR